MTIVEDRPIRSDLGVNGAERRSGALGLTPGTGGVSLSDGVELVGRYQGSGRQDERYLARRPDGNWVELTQLLYLVVSNLDGQRASGEVAARIEAEIGREVTAENVDYLVEEKLVPLGLINVEGTARASAGPRQILVLRLKKPLLPASVVRGMARVLRHLFHIPVVLAVLALFVAVEIRLIAGGHLRVSTTQLLNHPQLVLVVYGLVLASMVFHEIGHASACAYGGARPGEIGGGFYLVWPALYTNVTDAYRLGRAGRVRTDLGGVYFNCVFAVAMAGLYWVTGYGPLVLAVALSTFLMLEQLLPFLRFDGYWIVSDLAGVPDLFPRLPGALGRLVPGTRGAHRPARVGVEDLQPYSRRIITGWAVVTAVVLPVELVLTLVVSASLVMSMWNSLVAQYDDFRAAISLSHFSAAGLDVFEAALVMFMLIGLAYIVFLVTSRLLRYAIRRWGKSWSARILVTVIVIGTISAPIIWSATQLRLVHSS
jgi:putative peptide zinc metalloprotease protein